MSAGLCPNVQLLQFLYHGIVVLGFDFLFFWRNVRTRSGEFLAVPKTAQHLIGEEDGGGVLFRPALGGEIKPCAEDGNQLLMATEWSLFPVVANLRSEEREHLECGARWESGEHGRAGWRAMAAPPQGLRSCLIPADHIPEFRPAIPAEQRADLRNGPPSNCGRTKNGNKRAGRISQSCKPDS